MADKVKIIAHRHDFDKREQVEAMRKRLIRRVHRSHLLPLAVAVFLVVCVWRGVDVRTWQVLAPCALMGVIYFLSMALSVCPRCGRRFFGGLGWLFGFA
ncbi:MAG TPA: hypothetical protein VIJ93_06520, partial [bacterium]